MNILNNPLVPISNNRAENAIRPFVVGRKQWLFSNTVKGAKSECSILFNSRNSMCEWIERRTIFHISVQNTATHKEDR